MVAQRGPGAWLAPRPAGDTLRPRHHLSLVVGRIPGTQGQPDGAWDVLHPSEQSLWIKNRHILARQQLETVCIPLVWCLDKCLLLDFGVTYNPEMDTT